MEYVIAVYRSRYVAMQAYDFLLRKGICAVLVSTPAAAKVGCGLSVKFSKGSLDFVQSALSSEETFAGFFLVKNTMSGTVVSRLDFTA